MPIDEGDDRHVRFVEEQMAKNLHDKIAALMGGRAAAPKAGQAPKAAVPPREQN